MAHGERREYSGALYVGELVIPDGFQDTSQPLVRGQLDVAKSTWEDFALANKHLPSHELEREWANRFAGSSVGVGIPSMGNTSTVRQQINGEDPGSRMALAETNYRSPYPPVQHPTIQNIYRGKSTLGENNTRNMDPYTESNLNRPHSIPLAAGTPQGSFQETSRNNTFTPNKRNGTTVQGQASEETHRGAQHQLHLPLRASAKTHKPNLPVRGSSSQSTRSRPWEM